MRIALVQYDPRFGEVRSNLDRVESLVADVEADVFLLPELFQTGYFFRDENEARDLAEDLDGPSIRRLRAWSSQKGAAFCAGFAERGSDGLYNSAVFVDAEATLAHYRKIHLFDREKLVFRAGDLPFPVAQHRGVRWGLMICFDWRFPESARSLAFAGADCILHPSNLVLPWCPDAMITRALENNVFIATCDRTGDDVRDGERLHFIGRSQVVDPKGRRLGQLGEEEEGVLVVEFDPALARDKQVTAHNDLFEDLRPEFYRQHPEL